MTCKADLTERVLGPSHHLQGSPYSGSCSVLPLYAGPIERFASVYPLVTPRALARVFTYSVPEGVGKGAVVDVPFGRGR
jgi:hypothetical protein